MRIIIVGAGIAGCTAARLLAESGRKVEVWEKRSHVAGNAYDCLNSQGILIHRYGPHIFHTKLKEVYDLLSRFTDWYPLEHRVLARVGDKMLPVPFNLISLEKLFSPAKAARLKDKLIAVYGEGARVPVLDLMRSEDRSLKALGETVYRIIFRIYTTKQWGTDPKHVDENTLKRVPVLVSRDTRYFQDPYQGMPLQGYTALCEKMLDHPGIALSLDTDAFGRIAFREGRLTVDGEPAGEDTRVIFTGPLDALCGYAYGPLPYRTLDFVFTELDEDRFQEAGVVNYTVDQPFTRITEFKTLTGQTVPGKTCIMREYSRDQVRGDEPYYPIAGPESAEKYRLYREMLPREVIPLGRLAEYRYYNMDQVVLQAMKTCEDLIGRTDA
ncbi:MAG: UDP-galactopyranose mutase [Clostridia bacterium]|nr:UDP-galactopyranose mutase [Clostridia bacterium]